MKSAIALFAVLALPLFAQESPATLSIKPSEYATLAPDTKSNDKLAQAETVIKLRTQQLAAADAAMRDVQLQTAVFAEEIVALRKQVADLTAKLAEAEKGKPAAPVAAAKPATPQPKS